MKKLKIKKNLLNKLILIALKNKIIVILLTLILILWGVIVSPVNLNIPFISRKPVAVDAIPNIGENQQVIFIKWSGHSPKDVEEQITYPLSGYFMGIPGVKAVRGKSAFGFASIYVIFKDSVEFYWSRSRLLEKLNSIPSNLLPDNVTPSLGPPATAMGQVYWYTLEGRDQNGNSVGGWDLHELRTIQDYFVKYALMSADGVAEVASIGGFVKEYTVEVNPNLMRDLGVSLKEIITTVRNANKDIGAGTIEMNGVEYVISGIGQIKQIDDIKLSVIKMANGTPIRIKDVAKVLLGPAPRRGLLDKSGAEVVGGVVTVREGANVYETIKNLKEKIKITSKGLPEKKLKNGKSSKVTIVPFYDRSTLIKETLGTLKNALRDEIIITVIVIIIMLGHLKSSLIISGLLPLGVLLSFIAMKLFNVEANILSLSGIAIAIGTMVDMGIVIMENIIRHSSMYPKRTPFETVANGTTEVASAILTSVATTVISFLPVFSMTATEGKLFRPLAFTKTFALMSALIVALFLIPVLALIFFDRKNSFVKYMKIFFSFVLFIVGTLIFKAGYHIQGSILFVISVFGIIIDAIPLNFSKYLRFIENLILGFLFIYMLTIEWLPLGREKTFSYNLFFVLIVIGGILGFFIAFMKMYKHILKWSLNHKITLIISVLLVSLFGIFVWKGYKIVPTSLKHTAFYTSLKQHFPGLQNEFMPYLDEGTFLYMPTVMPHASLGEAKDIMQKQDILISNIPEVKSVVGKLGRADTPLDPAPISMFETVINYYGEYYKNAEGEIIRFAYDSKQTDFMRDFKGKELKAIDGKHYIVQGKFLRDKEKRLIPDSNGKSFRLWRLPLNPELNPGRKHWKGITSPQDIWNEIVKKATVPGSTIAPKLQPISTRIVMLQTGIRSNLGIKIFGNSAKTVEETAKKMEQIIKKVEGVNVETVSVSRAMGKAYLEFYPKRKILEQYGLNVKRLMIDISVALGGLTATNVTDGKERIAVTVKFMRDFRLDINEIRNMPIKIKQNQYVPLSLLAEIKYTKGPQVIKSENAFKISSVVFDSSPGYSDIKTINNVTSALNSAIKNKTLIVPPNVTFSPTGTYENHIHFMKTLKIVLPLALILIFIIIYLQFKSIPTTFIIFSSISIAWSGGFILIWLYSQSWFMNFSFMGTNLRELFQIHPINMSVAVWVGFLALFGIATDDGVVMATYLKQLFSENEVKNTNEINELILTAGSRRIRACLMTTATTLLALLPVITSKGRGSDIMVPMAIPVFGGMIMEVFTMLVVPLLYSIVEEVKLKLSLLGFYTQQSIKSLKS